MNFEKVLFEKYIFKGFICEVHLNTDEIWNIKYIIVEMRIAVMVK